MLRLVELKLSKAYMRFWLVEVGEPLPIDDGGRKMRCGTLAELLAGSGHEVTWWASIFDHSRKRFRSEKRSIVEVVPGFDLRLLHGPGYSRNVSVGRWWHNRVVAKDFYRLANAQSQEPDLIFCCIPTPDLAAQCIDYGHKRQVPVIVDVRDIWPSSFVTALPGYLRNFARLILAGDFRTMDRICRSATGLTAVSTTYLNWALNIARRVATEHDGVFPLGYPDPMREPHRNSSSTTETHKRWNIRPGALVVSFVGAFGISYDLTTVIEAARILQQQNPPLNVHFVIAGDGDNSETLKTLAGPLSNTTFTGWLSASEISALLAISSIGLAPYRKSATQSLPNKPFEYMASALPLLSSLRGELEEMIQLNDIGRTYQPENVSSLVSALIWLSDHPKERKAMGKRARLLFDRRFSTAVVYRALVNHLERVAKSYMNAAPPLVF